MDFQNRKLDELAQRFLGVVLADAEPLTATSWILMPESLVLKHEEFETASLKQVDQYLVALNEHSQSADAWDLAVYTESVTWAGAYVGEVLRRAAKRELHWTCYDDAITMHSANVEELGERNDFNEFVLCAPSGRAVSPMDAASAVFVDGYLQSVDQFVAEEAAMEPLGGECQAFAEAKQRNDESLYQLPQELREQLTGAAAHDQRVWAKHFQTCGANDLAVEALFKSLQQAPFELSTLHELARLHALQGDQDRALAFYQRALAIEPNDAITYQRRGHLYWATGKSELAISDLKAAAEADPTLERYESLAGWFSELGRHEESAQTLAQGLTIADSTDSETRARMTEQIAEQYLLEGKSDQAKEAIDQLLQQHGVAAGCSAWMCRGRIFAAQQRWGEAAADFVAAARLDDQNPVAFARLAWIWSTAPDDNVRKPDKALQAARKAQALAKNENDVLVLEAMAAALARNIRYEDAIATQQKAVAAAEGKVQRDAAKRLKAYQSKQPWTQRES